MRQSSLARAQQMAESWLYDGDPRSYESEINELLSIDGNEIKPAISKFIKDGESALLNVVPSPPSVGEVTTNVQ
jgi:hypothetical protein